MSLVIRSTVQLQRKGNEIINMSIQIKIVIGNFALHELHRTIMY
jgi:hypothetical protein